MTTKDITQTMLVSDDKWVSSGAMETPRPTSALANYMKHHHTGAVAGCHLAVHLAQRGDASPSLRGLDIEVRRDRDSLEALMDALGIERGPVHRSATLVANAVGVLRISSGWRGQSSSRSLLELEALAIGIEGKRRLWMSLKLLAGHHTAIDGSQIDELLRRADEQLVAVENARLHAATQAFHAGTPEREQEHRPV